MKYSIFGCLLAHEAHDNCRSILSAALPARSVHMRERGAGEGVLKAVLVVWWLQVQGRVAALIHDPCHSMIIYGKQ